MPFTEQGEQEEVPRKGIGNSRTAEKLVERHKGTRKKILSLGSLRPASLVNKQQNTFQGPGEAIAQ